MSSKRKLSTFQTDRSGPTNSGWDRDDRDGGAKKQKGSKKHNEKPGTINWVKKRKRTIERLLQRGEDLPANVKADLQRELAHHESTIDEHFGDKKRKTMIKKYHMVRFFERKKAERLAKQIQIKLKDTKETEKIERLKRDLHIAEVDSHYARYFPFLERYISLYPVSTNLKTAADKKTEEQSKAALSLHGERPPLWKDIEKAMGKGPSALEAIRDRRPTGDAQPKSSIQQSSKPTAASKMDKSTRKEFVSKPVSKPAPKPIDPTLNRRQRRKLAREASPSSPSEDGGGFFEED